MKTTVSLRDDLLRRLKARAALRGQPLSKYMEESLERSLQQDEEKSETVQDWLESLPHVSQEATRHLKKVLSSDDFRPVEPVMWK